MVSKRALVTGGVALGLLALTVIGGKLIYDSYDSRHRARDLESASAITADSLLRQGVTFGSYVVLGENVDLGGLQNLLKGYEASVRTANGTGYPLVERLLFEERGLSLGYVTPLTKDGKLAGAWVWVVAYQALGGKDATHTPTLDQVAKAGLRDVPAIITDLGRNIVGGLSPITAPQGLEMLLPDGKTAPFSVRSETGGDTVYITKPQ